MTTIDTRKAEAERIAASEQYPIRSHDENWTFFTLDDGQTVNDTEGQWPNVKVVGTKTIRTHFEWVAGRFEGFVS